jgi:hypothetical protein
MLLSDGCGGEVLVWERGERAERERERERDNRKWKNGGGSSASAAAAAVTYGCRREVREKLRGDKV